MPKLKDRKPKTALISVRTHPKLRYGLEMVARNHRMTFSDVVERAVVSFLENDGIAAKDPDRPTTLLDRIWAETESERLEKLVANRDKFMISPEEFWAGTIIEQISSITGFDRLNPGAWEALDQRMDMIRALARDRAMGLDIPEFSIRMEEIYGEIGLGPV